MTKETELPSIAVSAVVGFGVVALLLAMLMLVTAAFAEPLRSQSPRSETFYDRNGSFAGSSSSHGNSTTFTDRNGRFDGTAIRNSDGTTSFYDRNGRFSGSRSNTTQPR